MLAARKSPAASAR